MKEINLAQNTPEWLEFRKSGIGASEIASIAEVEGAFKYRQEVLEEKLGFEKPITDHQKKIFAEGHEWEAVVRENLNASGRNFQPIVCVCDEEDRFFASLDGFERETNTILEIKSVLTQERFEMYREQPPSHYIAQVQWQMLCSGAKAADLAFVHKGDVFIVKLSPSDEWQKMLVGEAYDFLKELDAIKSGTMPAPVKQIATPEVTRLAFLKAQEKEMQIQVDMVNEEIKALAEKMLLENNARRLESESVVIEWVEREGSIDYKKIPELKNLDLTKYRKNGSRYVKVTNKKGTTK